MPKVPPVQELFAPSKPRLDSNFEYDQKESKQQITLIKKKSLAPLPPMKKFGGYKPKIFGDAGNDIIPVSSKTQAPEAPSSPPRTRPVLTQPKAFEPKPFIIGDKDTPMSLGSFDNSTDEDVDKEGMTSQMEDMHIYEEPVISHYSNAIEVNNNNVDDIDNNNIIKLFNENKENNDNDNDNHNDILSKQFNNHDGYNSHQTSLAQNGDDNFIFDNDNQQLVANNNTSEIETSGTDNPVFHATETEKNGTDSNTEPDGVFIPLPDYDEEEKTMDFAEEDSEELIEEQTKQNLEEQQRKQPLQKHQQENGMKVYDGEDLSKYLSDDDDDDLRLRQKINKPVPPPLKKSHSMFMNRHGNSNTTTKRKLNKSKEKAFSSVRNFSFADSKYGTRRKSDVNKINFTEFNADHDNFLATSERGDSYETFLRSKHGVQADRIPIGKAKHQQLNAKQRNGNVWKKLTIGFKQKSQKNGYDMNVV